MGLFNRCQKLIARIRDWLFKNGRYKTISIEEVPDKPNKKIIYLVGEGDYLWFAVFQCPCGCRETIQLSLMPGSNPKWKITKHNNGTVSLHPSVWRKTGCKSHFFIIQGQVKWC